LETFCQYSFPKQEKKKSKPSSNSISESTKNGKKKARMIQMISR